MSMNVQWFPRWLIDYTILHEAIIVSGDYRLLPESNGKDIVEDVNDLWNWLRNDLQAYLDKVKPGIEVDLSNVITHGGSAGMCFQTAGSEIYAPRDLLLVKHHFDHRYADPT